MPNHKIRLAPALAGCREASLQLSGAQQFTAIASEKPAGSLASQTPLILGQSYAAEVTALLAGKTELLLGGRYLLAASPFNFQVGDKLFLRLVAQQPVLTFQLALPTGEAGLSAPTAGEAAATLLRAAGMPDSATARAVASMLINAGLPLTQQSLVDASFMLANLPAAAVNAFLPLYREFLQRGIKADRELLRQMALLSSGVNEGAGMFALLLPLRRLQQRPQGQPDGQSSLENEAEVAQGAAGSGTIPVEGSSPPAADELAGLMQLFYSSPEMALKGAGSEVELRDLSNLQQECGRPDPTLLSQLTALRVRAALSPPPTRWLLPLSLDGEDVLMELEHSPLGQEYYQPRHHLRLRLTTARQGPVEIHLSTNGSKLAATLLVQEPATLRAYEAELPQLEAALRSPRQPYRLHKLVLSAASLGPEVKPRVGDSEVSDD